VLTIKNKKTGGRSMAMLELGKILGDQTLITQMDNLFHQNIYQSSPTGYEGVLYEQQQNWQPYVLDGTTENWVTSEAMGITMIALLIQ
jgi:UTP:GlnB (protein PII) uridylyltransferase